MGPETRQGEVSSFGANGWGELTDAGGRAWPFHCTAVADGSRHIEVGTAVYFSLRPGHHGRWEANPVSPRRRPG